jgi:hypothetical protein
MDARMRKALPLVAEVLDHPRVQEYPNLVEAIETCADEDKFRRLSYTKLALYMGIQLGVIKELLDENDSLRASLLTLTPRDRVQ